MPDMLNVFDIDILCRCVKEAGFIIEKVSYIKRECSNLSDNILTTKTVDEKAKAIPM